MVRIWSMFDRALPPVNRALGALPGVLALVACVETQPPADPVPAAAPAPPAEDEGGGDVPEGFEDWPFRTSTRIGPSGLEPLAVPATQGPPSARGSAPPRPSAAPTGPEVWPGYPSTAHGYMGALERGRPDTRYGEALLEAIGQLPEERAKYGVGGFDPDSLWEDDETGICEDARVLFDVEGEGEEWELSLRVTPFSWLYKVPDRVWYSLSDGCVDALLASGGDLEGMRLGEDVCTIDDVAAFFPETSACYECLVTDGDYDRCVEEAACPTEASRHLVVTKGGRAYGFTVLETEVVLCAPDERIPAWLLAPDLTDDEPLPSLYTHDDLVGIAFYMWSDAVRAMSWYGSSFGEDAIWDVNPAFVDHLGPPGEEGEGLQGRLALPASIELEDGSRVELSYAFGAYLGGVSAWGGGGRGWGISPLALRPDADNPDDPEDTLGRDFLAAATLKIASTRDGVIVAPFNWNRCLEWGPPEADGSSSCLEVDAWVKEWYNDGFVSWWNKMTGTTYVFPLNTLASTGLPDPAIPGDVVVRVMGSTVLADDGWEDCSWPDVYVPDRMPLYDTQPTAGDVPYASFDGQTWRFERDGDIRLGLNTNQTRGFCPPAWGG